MRFKIDWARLIFGKKFTVFLFFFFVLQDNFQVQEFLRYEFGGLIHGGAYFRNFTVQRKRLRICVKEMPNILKIF